MASSIGIKLANGEFFPIMDEVASTEQNLELTTMRDDQESVQINLFKKTDDLEPEYIGSLIVEEISKGIAGDPTINLKIKLDEDENLSAEAIDEASGAKQSLKVSLKTLAASEFNVPDFDLSVMDDNIGEDPDRDNVLIPDMDEDFSSDFIDTTSRKSEKSIEEPEAVPDNEEKPSPNIVEETTIVEEKRKKGMPTWLVVLLILLCIGALVVAILLLTKKMPNSDKDKLAATDSSNVEKVETTESIDKTTDKAPKEDPKEKAAAEAKKKAEEEAKKKAEAEAKKKAEEEAKRKAEEEAKEAARKKAEEEAKKKAPKVDARGTVRYKIKWGDTLWDLSETFYKTPWAYKKIARHNKIKNPNLIIAGTYIEIPPK